MISFHNQAFTYQCVCDAFLSSSENTFASSGLRVHARMSEGVGVQIGDVPFEFQDGTMIDHGRIQPLEEGDKFDPAAVSTGEDNNSRSAAAAWSHAVAGSLRKARSSAL